MMERLMRISIYQKDQITNTYNYNVFTKLVKNYRSHPAIIQASNQMFYNNELIPCGPECKFIFFNYYLTKLIFYLLF